jgi:hypothetical protein
MTPRVETAPFEGRIRTPPELADDRNFVQSRTLLNGYIDEIEGKSSSSPSNKMQHMICMTIPTL